jgi:hypothetical protein
VIPAGELRLHPILEDYLFVFPDHILYARLLFSSHPYLL